jgi:hypothetical protein
MLPKSSQSEAAVWPANWPRRGRLPTFGQHQKWGFEDLSARAGHHLPTEIGFLANYGIAPGILVDAAAKARSQGVTADAVVLAEGKVSEYHFYRSLAHHLRLNFVDGRVTLGLATLYPQSVHAGLAPLADPNGPAFLAAPRGAAISHLVSAQRRNGALCGNLALTTPTHLSWLVRAASREAILRRAWASGLPTGTTPHQRRTVLAIAALIAFLSLIAPGAMSLVCSAIVSLVFIAVIWLRLTATAASLEVSAPRSRIKMAVQRFAAAPREACLSAGAACHRQYRRQLAGARYVGANAGGISAILFLNRLDGKRLEPICGSRS